MPLSYAHSNSRRSRGSVQAVSRSKYFAELRLNSRKVDDDSTNVMVERRKNSPLSEFCPDANQYRRECGITSDEFRDDFRGTGASEDSES